MTINRQYKDNRGASALFAGAMLLGLVLMLGPTIAAAQSGHGGHDAAKVTLSGEVVDLACMMQHPDKARGAGHAKCGESCINKGLPAGLLVGGELYLLLASGHDPVNDLVASYAGQKVSVKGEPKEQHGMKALVVDSIEGAD
ncbi:MAG: hypothetical protein ACE5E4_06290 [Candidatus Binatia bacterium]